MFPVSPLKRCETLQESAAYASSDILEECKTLSTKTYPLLHSLGTLYKTLEIGQSYLYGFSSVYRLLLDRRTGFLGFHVPHGYSFNLKYADYHDLYSPCATLSYSPLYQDRFRQRYPFRTIIPAPNPLKTLEHLLSCHSTQPSTSPASSSVIYFLSHSTTRTNALFDEAAIESDIHRLRQNYKYVNLSVYFTDVGRITPSFRSLFDSVYCCGHMLDPCFCLRLYHLLASHTCVSGNSIGSHYFYAASLGIKIDHAPCDHVPYESTSELSSDSYTKQLHASSKYDISSLLYKSLNQLALRDLTPVLNLLQYSQPLSPEFTSTLKRLHAGALPTIAMDHLDRSVNKVYKAIDRIF